MWRRSLRQVRGSVMSAIRLRRPPQWGQRRTSTAKVRSRSSAQVLRLAASGQSDGEVAAGGAGGTMRSRKVDAGAREPW